MKSRKSNNTSLNAIARSQNTNLLPNMTEKSVTFAGGTTNAIGDLTGTQNPHTLYTVTGTVVMTVFGICETNLAGATSTVEVGTALLTPGLIAQTIGTDVDINEIWHDATPDSSVEAISILAPKIVSQDVILTVGTADMTAGVIGFICLWAPVSDDGNVV